MGLILILFAVLLLVLVLKRPHYHGYWGYGHKGCYGPGPQSGPGEKSPMEILRERYARGEIDKAEFEQRKTDLQ